MKKQEISNNGLDEAIKEIGNKFDWWSEWNNNGRGGIYKFIDNDIKVFCSWVFHPKVLYISFYFNESLNVGQKIELNKSQFQSFNIPNLFNQEKEFNV